MGWSPGGPEHPRQDRVAVSFRYPARAAHKGGHTHAADSCLELSLRAGHSSVLGHRHGHSCTPRWCRYTDSCRMWSDAHVHRHARLHGVSQPTQAPPRTPASEIWSLPFLSPIPSAGPRHAHQSGTCATTPSDSNASSGIRPRYHVTGPPARVHPVGHPGA